VGGAGCASIGSAWHRAELSARTFEIYCAKQCTLCLKTCTNFETVYSSELYVTILMIFGREKVDKEANLHEN